MHFISSDLVLSIFLFNVLISILINCSEMKNLKHATTKVTKENYALAESQIIFTDYVSRIANATESNGVNVFMRQITSADPKDRTVVRINFDTLYSFAIIDLETTNITLTMPTKPESDSNRYQSTWVVTEEHYNPMAFSKPGKYVLSKDNIGSRYASLVIRTQVNMLSPVDMEAAVKLQSQLDLIVHDDTAKGSYSPSHVWDMNEVLQMRAMYMTQVTEKVEQGIVKSSDLFGKKGEISLENHNMGTAYGWGGLTADQAVYLPYSPDPMSSLSLMKVALKDVPVDAFWSITIYDSEGYPQGDEYNVNSSFAKPNDDGTVWIYFGAKNDEGYENFMDTFIGWNAILRLYLPTEAYFNESWVQPELVLVVLDGLA